MTYSVANQVVVPVRERKYFQLSDDTRKFEVSVQWCGFVEKTLNKYLGKRWFKRPSVSRGTWLYTVHVATNDMPKKLSKWLKDQYQAFRKKYVKRYTMKRDRRSSIFRNNRKNYAQLRTHSIPQYPGSDCWETATPNRQQKKKVETPKTITAIAGKKKVETPKAPKATTAPAAIAGKNKADTPTAPAAIAGKNNVNTKSVTSPARNQSSSTKNQPSPAGSLATPNSSNIHSAIANAPKTVSKFSIPSQRNRHTY